ncbi:MAG: glycosyltransferase family 4 protein [bacterium]|nr:glycosyltransferase family 4 protein [bacterium]
MKTPRVLHVAHAAHPLSRGGVETYLLRLFPAMAQAGWESALLLPLAAESDAGRVSLRHGGLPVFRVAMPRKVGGVRGAIRSFKSRSALADAMAAIGEWRPDLIHVHQMMFHDYRLPLHARSLGLPVVTTVHDFWFACHRITLTDAWGEPCPGSPGGRRCSRCLAAHRRLALVRRLLWAPVIRMRQQRYRRAVLSSDAVIVASPFAAGVLREALELVALPAEVFAYPVPACERRRQLRRDGDQPARLGFIGSLRRHKGLDVLAMAAHLLGPRGYTLEVFGDLEVDPGYVSRLRETSGGWMRFRGPFEPEEIMRVLDELDVLVVPSLWRETGPLVALEALAKGLAVVGSRLGGLVELAARFPGQVQLFEPGKPDELAAAVLRAARFAGSDQAPGIVSPIEHAARLAGLYRNLARVPEPVPGVDPESVLGQTSG